MVQPISGLAKDVLFGVSRPGRDVFAPGVGDETAGRGGADAGIEGHQITGHHAAAGIACAAQARSVHFGPRFEVIEAADLIPDHVFGDIFAQQNRRRAHIHVLDGRIVAWKAVAFDAFALAERIDAQRRDALRAKQFADALVAGFAAVAVAATDNHSRKRPRALRQIQIGGDEKSRKAFVNNLLDAISLALNRAKRFGVQRGAIRKTAQAFDKLRSERLLILGNVAIGEQSFHIFEPAVQRRVRLRAQPKLNHFCGRAGSGAVGRRDVHGLFLRSVDGRNAGKGSCQQ
ncbi:MAG: hypothetical protein BWZ10_02935 [candidate division BRC1 bacterium ADurb.BinA364]|nr:MAG: hypothetical protein BWZ10_02935 [candidate division BRC1 bacterium ADurb.BinA364]